MSQTHTLPMTQPPRGFRPVPSADDRQILQRQAFSFTKMSILDTFIISTSRDTLTVDELRHFSAQAMLTARKHKHFLPCGFFSALVTYPVVYLDTADPELIAFIEGYAPKHYSAFEFPVIAERSTSTLYFYQGTPVWGALYYRGFRTEAQELIDF